MTDQTPLIETAAEAIRDNSSFTVEAAQSIAAAALDSLAQHRDDFQRLAAEHVYSLNLRTGAICDCGYAPPREQRPWPWGQQDWHREHLIDTLLALITGSAK